MTMQALIFGTDLLYERLKPLYDAAVKRGEFEILAYANFKDEKFSIVDSAGKKSKPSRSYKFNLAIISARPYFYKRMKILEKMGVPRKKIIDGTVFMVPKLNFSRLLNEGIAYGTLDKTTFKLCIQTIYPQVYNVKNKRLKLTLGSKSYINGGSELIGKGEVSIKSFCSIARNTTFSIGENNDHNFKNVSSAPAWYFDWESHKRFMPPQGICKIEIGNDVWIGRGCIFKSVNPERPLVIGDGAVVAADSVVVKNVPPYAVVGGNPAQIIKYRFEPHIIEALLRIKWWDWDFDKMNENFKYFDDVENFISMHDKG